MQQECEIAFSHRTCVKERPIRGNDKSQTRKSHNKVLRNHFHSKAAKATKRDFRFCPQIFEAFADEFFIPKNSTFTSKKKPRRSEIFIVTSSKAFDSSVGAASSQYLAVGTHCRCRSYEAWHPWGTVGYNDFAPTELLNTKKAPGGPGAFYKSAQFGTVYRSKYMKNSYGCVRRRSAS